MRRWRVQTPFLTIFCRASRLASALESLPALASAAGASAVAGQNERAAPTPATSLMSETEVELRSICAGLLKTIEAYQDQNKRNAELLTELLTELSDAPAAPGELSERHQVSIEGLQKALSEAHQKSSAAAAAPAASGSGGRAEKVAPSSAPRARPQREAAQSRRKSPRKSV